MGSTQLEKIKDILSEQQDTNIKQKPLNIYRGGGQSEFYTSEISASPRYQEPVFL